LHARAWSCSSFCLLSWFVVCTVLRNIAKLTNPSACSSLCPLSLPLGSIVQQTGNFKIVAVIMGCLLLGCGSMVAVLKPLAACRAKRISRAEAASDDEEQQQQNGGSSSGGDQMLPAGPGDVGGAVSGEPSACVLVGGLKDAAVGAGVVRTAGGTAGLAAAADSSDGAASSDWAHRRPAAAQAQRL
jgi:hypothetical protein